MVIKATGSNEILPYPELQAFLKDQFEKYNGGIQSTGLSDGIRSTIKKCLRHGDSGEGSR